MRIERFEITFSSPKTHLEVLELLSCIEKCAKLRLGRDRLGHVTGEMKDTSIKSIFLQFPYGGDRMSREKMVMMVAAAEAWCYPDPVRIAVNWYHDGYLDSYTVGY